MSAERRVYGGIEAGGTKFICAVAQSPVEILKSTEQPTTEPDETFANVLKFFLEAAAEYGPICAIGAASFGPVDIDRSSRSYGTILNTPKPGWADVSFIDALARLNAPFFVDTDVNGAALGEAVAGAGNGLRIIAYVTVGTGIGAGVVKNGLPQAGFGHYEFGHIRPPHDKSRDPYAGCCPFHSDCLEGLASGPAIMNRWEATLSDLAQGHEAVALEAEYLSHLALTLILSHMPERIIFGGGAGLLKKLRLETKKLIGGYVDAGPLAGDLSDYIVPPGLGDFSGAVGAVVLAERALAEVAP